MSNEITSKAQLQHFEVIGRLTKKSTRAMVSAQHLHSGGRSWVLKKCMQKLGQTECRARGSSRHPAFTALLTWFRASSFREFSTFEPSASVMSNTAENHFNRKAKAKRRNAESLIHLHFTLWRKFQWEQQILACAAIEAHRRKTRTCRTKWLLTAHRALGPADIGRPVSAGAII